MEAHLCSVLFVTLSASYVMQEILHREGQPCAAVFVTATFAVFPSPAWLYTSSSFGTSSPLVPKLENMHSHVSKGTDSLAHILPQ